MNELVNLANRLGVSFENEDMLTQAFVHRSYLNENPEFSLQNNERLEFLGDAVLELVVTRRLFEEYPDKSEGELTAWRAALVNTRMLAETARGLGFDEHLLLSKGEAGDNGKGREYILANTLEAFVGAVYLDQGLEAAERFIGKQLLPKLPEILEKNLFRDAKSAFQELAQQKARITPTYRVLEESGPDHAKSFLVGVFLDNKKTGEGEGSSKQEAEERAAQDALEQTNW